MSVATVVEKLMEKLKGSQQVILFQEEVDDAIAQRRSLHVHLLLLLLLPKNQAVSRFCTIRDAIGEFAGGSV